VSGQETPSVDERLMVLERWTALLLMWPVEEARPNVRSQPPVDPRLTELERRVADLAREVEVLQDAVRMAAR
jgi:hypothetical protein